MDHTDRNGSLVDFDQTRTAHSEPGNTKVRFGHTEVVVQCFHGRKLENQEIGTVKVKDLELVEVGEKVGNY